MFSVPLSVKLPCPGVTRRTALWSSDFPPLDSALSASLGAIVWLTATLPLSNPNGQIPKPKTQQNKDLGFGLWDFSYPSISCLIPYCSSFL